MQKKFRPSGYEPVPDRVNKCATMFDSDRKIGQIAVFNPEGECLASRECHTQKEARSIVVDFQAIIYLSPETVDELVKSFAVLGLPE